MARPPEEGEGKLGGRVFQRELMMYPQARGLLRGLYEPSGSACPSFLGFPAKTHAPSVPGQLGCRRPSRRWAWEELPRPRLQRTQATVPSMSLESPPQAFTQGQPP